MASSLVQGKVEGYFSIQNFEDEGVGVGVNDAKTRVSPAPILNIVLLGPFKTETLLIFRWA
jgi:hypothetical protein